MQKYPEIYLDYHCEITEYVKHYAKDVFGSFCDYPITPGAVYVLGRSQMKQHAERVRNIIESRQAHIVFSNPAEGSETFYGQIHYLGVRDLVVNGSLPVISGGDIDPGWRNLPYDSFVNGVLQMAENNVATRRFDEIFEKKDKPYKFLFLNGRLRTHRKWMLESMRQRGLLDSSLYTCLETGASPRGGVTLIQDQEDLMYRVEPLKYLPAEYEVELYTKNIGTHNSSDGNYAKYNLFNNEWGEVYIKPEPYIDTYFSLVTETVFHTPYSFRTEKIWKAILMGHPWVCVANPGFYRDMHNLGFKTFGSLIDESFDAIENPQERLERIADVVQELCRSDLSSFLDATQSICKYNQYHLRQYQKKVVDELPDRFLNFIKSVANNE